MNIKTQSGLLNGLLEDLAGDLDDEQLSLVERLASSVIRNAAADGWDEGYDEGHKDGYREGYEEGEVIMREKWMQDLVYEIEGQRLEGKEPGQVLGYVTAQLTNTI